MPIDIEALAARLRAHGRAGRGNPYPAELRNAVLEFVAAAQRGGRSPATAARQLGLAPHTVERWQAVKAFVPVRVVASPQLPSFVVHGPCGTRIEGLDFESLAGLLRRLA